MALFHLPPQPVRQLFGGFAHSSANTDKNLESVIIFTVSNKKNPC